MNAAVGIVAGLLVAHIRLHLGLSGHKLLLWLTPVVAARLLLKSPLGTTAGSLSAACSSLAVGGNLAGGVLLLPLVGVAGAIVDCAVGFAERRVLPAWLLVPLIASAGAGAGLVCAVKRVLLPVFRAHTVAGLAGPPARLLSYAFFGLLAGLVGAVIAAAVHRTGLRGGKSE